LKDLKECEIVKAMKKACEGGLGVTAADYHLVAYDDEG